MTSRWRTGDVPWFVLVGGCLALAAAVLGVVSTGSAFGVVLAAALITAAVAVVIRWSSAPFAPHREAPDEAGADPTT